MSASAKSAFVGSIGARRMKAEARARKQPPTMTEKAKHPVVEVPTSPQQQRQPRTMKKTSKTTAGSQAHRQLCEAASNKRDGLSNLKPTIDQQPDHGRKQDCKLEPDIKKEGVLADPEPHSDDDEDDFDIVELDKVMIPGDNVDEVLNSLLFAGYNVATNPRTTVQSVGQNMAVQTGRAGAGTGQTQQLEEEIPSSDLKDLETVAADIELLLTNLQFAGYKLESKRKTTAMDVMDVEPLPKYIPLCRSSAAGDLQKK
ncbi:hypothetical protein R1sor_004477 [Riccia sorocarpa]|uniref:Uncharacterized protein n=1 Tax=Riccia sorocarpa TaxID=122646 RepID=A0ABD3HIT6_9MARC